MIKQPNLSIKALANELRQEVWEDRGDCQRCPNRQRDPDFGEYCESNSILDCNAEPCQVYQNYLETWYTGEELESLAKLPWRDTLGLAAAYIDLNDNLPLDDLTTAINQYQLIHQLKEQSKCK